MASSFRPKACTKRRAKRDSHLLEAEGHFPATLLTDIGHNGKCGERTSTHSGSPAKADAAKLSTMSAVFQRGPMNDGSKLLLGLLSFNPIAVAVNVLLSIPAGAGSL